ncbi:TPA: DUF4299 family protein [Streptococcus pneumoniae]|nr:DUF4299 family protein [Streptococcus pneumoniae]
MAKTFFIPNKQSILGEQEILNAKSILALLDGLESHSYDVVYLRQPLNRLEYIECAIVGQSQFLFKVSYADGQKAYRVDLPDLLTKTDWQIIKSFLDALLAYTGTDIEGLDGFDFEAYFQASIQAYLADPVARFTICQGIFNPIFFSRENLKSFLEADGLAQFEARVRAVQITGDGSKPEDYESIARLDYAKFLEVLPPSFYHQLDANQIEVQPILDKDFKTLAQEK